MEDNCIERLVAAGLTRENAAEVCNCYLSRRDEEGLESFVSSCECYKEEVEV